MKKYYTPSIEEFRVGFQFEVNYGSIENPNWVVDSLYTDQQVNVLPFMITSNIRVKYLDKEDIESLGWSCENGYYPSEMLFLKGAYYLTLYPGHEINVLITNANERPYFDGQVKNKTELITLLRQLGI